jgi:hypothetical protein
MKVKVLIVKIKTTNKDFGFFLFGTENKIEGTDSIKL